MQKGRAGGVFVENTPNAGIGRHLSESIAAMLESDSVTLYELLEARMFLEVPLAGRAAERSDEATIASLTEAIDGDLIVSQHQAIVRAIRRHQRTAAERAMRRHIEYMGAVLRGVDAGA